MNRARKDFQQNRYWAWTAVYLTAATAIGFVSALARPHAERNGAHLEAMAEYFFIMPCLCLSVLLLFLRIRLKTAIPMICLLVGLIWIANLTGHILGSIRTQMIDDFFGVNLAFAIGSMMSLSMLLLVTRKVWPLNHAGTDCPGCGYSLIGTRSTTCPECGRPYSLAELNITAEALQAE